jgi:hypothetical protein
MDIEHWLHGTADADQHSPTCRHHALPIGTLSANAVILQRSNTRKRRRSTSTSSVQPLQAHQNHLQRRGERSRGKSSATSHGCSDTTSATDESHQSEPDPYKRRKRRKTRCDRYDVKPAEIQNNAKNKCGDRTEKERMKSKRRTNGGAKSATVKDYKAKNVSASRLTV